LAKWSINQNRPVDDEQEEKTMKGNVAKLLLRKALPGLVVVLVTVWMMGTDARAETSVWKVKGPKATVYLAGSCHVLRQSDYPLPAAFEQAYARVRRVVFEAPLGEMEKPEYVQKLMMVAIYMDGTTLKDHLSPAVYARAEQFCSKRGYPFVQYQMFRPWMLSMTLTLNELQRIGVGAEHGVDQYFYLRAVNDGKSVDALETVDEQIGFMSKLDGGMGNDQVNETIDDLSLLENRITDILQAWRKGDDGGIEAFSLQELKKYPHLYSTLILDRNKKWLKKIETLIRGGSDTLVIVGVAHLAGKDSVVDLLRQRGYKILKLQD